MLESMKKAYDPLVKRLFDIAVAALAAVALSPILAVTALFVRLNLGSPVLFRQVRAGRNGKPFTILKFRTMTDARDTAGQPLPDDQRLTAFGEFLRKSSLDELPEIFNVIKGEMSLVGPRPLLMEYIGRYSPDQAKRLLMRPGITGLAQVSGRNSLSWEERFRLDVEYIENWSLRLDLRIILQTIATVLSRSGISAAGHATMPEFLSDSTTNEVPNVKPVDE